MTLGKLFTQTCASVNKHYLIPAVMLCSWYGSLAASWLKLKPPGLQLNYPRDDCLETGLSSDPYAHIKFLYLTCIF